MAIVIDPLGTPTIIYKDSDAAIVQMNATTFDWSVAPPPVIPRLCAHMIVIATRIDGNDSTLILPPDAKVGDKVEVHVLGGGGPLNQDGGQFVRMNSDQSEPFSLINVTHPIPNQNLIAVTHGVSETYGYTTFRKISAVPNTHQWSREGG